MLLSALPELYDVLRPLYCHFGYRTLKSMVEYVQTGLVLNVDVQQLLDEVVLSKVFPKIKGDRTVLTAKVFDQLEGWCQTHDMSLCLEKALPTTLSSTKCWYGAVLALSLRESNGIHDLEHPIRLVEFLPMF